MALKYERLARALAGSSASEVAMSFSELDVLVGGLPASAWESSWWANTRDFRRSQARAWMDAGYRADRVELGVAVTFVRSTDPVARRAARRGSILDGVDQLHALLKQAGYASVAAAVARHTVFLHPTTVAQAGGSALFPIVRDITRRGQFDTAKDGRRVLLDDNTGPTHAFLWSAGVGRGRDVQFNHLWNDSRNPDLYTALWNLCATPAFLAKTTDGSNHPEVMAAIRYRSFELYGERPGPEPDPRRPDGYDLLEWAPHPDPVSDLAAVLRARLRKNARSRTTIACREIGWLFSGREPDPTL